MPERAIFLLVEDNDNDVHLIRRAFLKAKVLNPVYAVNSGEEAISYFAGEGKYAHRSEYPLPSVVLLDLHMPGLDGFEVLRWIREQPWLASVRVVALTGSQDIRDVDKACKAGANSFLVKPADFDRLVEISKALAEYWMRVDKAAEAIGHFDPRLPGIPTSSGLGADQSTGRGSSPPSHRGNSKSIKDDFRL